jgi:hypothetical protein
VTSNASDRHFVVARNPRSSRLPFIVRLPVVGGAVFLASREPWPGPKDVFCLPLDAWPDDPELEEVERVKVVRCWRRGQAVHLVLERRQRRRSMFVWVESKGRTFVFWRTQKTMRTARPGLRVPGARGLDETLRIAVDVRERYPWRFKNESALVEQRELRVGDYAVLEGDAVVAVVERKSVTDLRSAAVGGQLAFVLAELEGAPHAAIVVEGRLSDLLKDSHAKPGWVLDVVVALQVAHPRVNWLFAETRGLAERVAFRWLAAAGRAHRVGSGIGEAPGGGRAEGPERSTSGPQAPAQYPLRLRDRRARLEEAIKLAERSVTWTAASYAEHFGISKATAYGDLKSLVEAGSLAKGDGRPGTYARVTRDDGGAS